MKGGELVCDPRYWHRRLRDAPNEEKWRAFYRVGRGKKQAIDAKHRQILSSLIRPTDSILDVGCGNAGLLDCMPGPWIVSGRYLGIDVTPKFIEEAKINRNPKWWFIVGDIRTIELPEHFDWAIMVSFRPMIKRHLGHEQWSKIEAKLRGLANRLLYLEYDPNDEGSVE